MPMQEMSSIFVEFWRFFSESICTYVDNQRFRCLSVETHYFDGALICYRKFDSPNHGWPAF